MSERTDFGPHLFRPEAIDEETAVHNAEFARRQSQNPVAGGSLQTMREDLEAGRGNFGPIVQSPIATERMIAGPAGPLPLRVFIPPRVDGAYLHLHGGGWVLGRPHHYDRMLQELATSCNVAVVGVDYRLAPEDPYPAGPDDCEAAAVWLARHAQAEFGTNRLLIGGASAGAHLSGVTLVRLRERHSARPFQGAVLMAGPYDLRIPVGQVTGSGPSSKAALLAAHADKFVPQDRRHEPDVSPLLADVSGLPPALFSVGTLDPLLDDTLFMYMRWIAAGNDAELAVYPGGLHGFSLQATRLAQRAIERSNAFVRRALQPVAVGAPIPASASSAASV